MSEHQTGISLAVIRSAAGCLNAGLVRACLVSICVWWQPSLSAQPPEPANQLDPTDPDGAQQRQFTETIQPLLQTYCQRCHNAEKITSGVRVDQIAGIPEDRHLHLLKDIRGQVNDGLMPPEDEPQMTAEQRSQMSAWIEKALIAAKSRKVQKNGAARRLTVVQYRNTLRDLLGLREDLTDTLAPDALSKDGFTNNEQTMTLSPLQIEAFFDIADKALTECLVDESQRPVIQTFRMDFGTNINAEPCRDNLILGANSELLPNADFVVTELASVKPFAFTPWQMQRRFEFIEGYVGNDTIRQWRTFDSLYHSVFACVRGTPGYPRGEAWQTIPEGLLLRPAIPSSEIFGESNTYGPRANFKISLRELPDHGNFRVTVRAANYSDGLLLSPETAPVASQESIRISSNAEPVAHRVEFAEAGIYQVDVIRRQGDIKGNLSLQFNEQHFAAQLEGGRNETGTNLALETEDQIFPFLLVRLPAGAVNITIRHPQQDAIRQLMLTKIGPETEMGKRFSVFEKRQASLGVYVGLRRDCGSTLALVEQPGRVDSSVLKDYVFEGAINDFPTPDVEKNNVNYLAGVREIGIRSEYTDGRDMPRLLIQSVQFEGPLYEQWPPASHTQFFGHTPDRQRAMLVTATSEPEDLQVAERYARTVLKSFADRAFRQPATQDEVESLVLVWKSALLAGKTFQNSIRDALLVVLTSPRFLFLIDRSAGPEEEPLTAWELASKLSYFLWNSPPDPSLLNAAEAGTLGDSLHAQVDRMIADPRFSRFIDEFASQWFSLDKFEVVSVDASRFPRLTRDAKTHLRQEPVHFLKHLIQHNLPVRNLVQSDFLLVNEPVAAFYDLAEKTESGLEFVAIPHGNTHLGGVMTQAAVLSGLSNGREPNPVKRGAWIARKIVAEPPEDPPPNVPQISEKDDSGLTLREKLEKHRNQPGCANCHAGIDPWGLPFEQYDAGGRFRGNNVDGRATLPDSTQVSDMVALKSYLAEDRLDQVAFSFMKHTATWAVGRTLTFQELEYLRAEGRRLRETDYRCADMIHFVVSSPIFLTK